MKIPNDSTVIRFAPASSTTPDAAIDPSADEVSISAATAMQAAFVQDPPVVLALFDALVVVNLSR
jgi:hypothetical protein